MKRNKISKIVGSALSIAILLGTCAGCSNSSSSTTASGSESKSSNVTLTMTGCSGNGWIYPVDKEIIEDFTKETGIKIDVQITPDDQYASVIKTKFASGDGPDIALIWSEANAAQFLPDKNFLDLSNEKWVSKLTEDAKRNQSYDGKVIGWGSQGGDYGWGIMYNKDMFEKNGCKVPDNWNDFIDDCDKLQKAGTIPFYGTLKDQWAPGIWMGCMGAMVENQEKGTYDKLNDNTKKFADIDTLGKFIDQYKELYDKGYLGKNALAGTVNDGITSVVNGKAAMALVNCSPEGWITSLGVKADMSKISMFPAPFCDNKSLVSYDGGVIRAVNKNGKHIEECKKYLDYISEDAQMEKYFSEEDRKTVSPAFQSFADKFKWADTTNDLIKNSDGKKFTIMETGIKYWDNTVEGKYIVQAILGSISSKQALENIDAERQKTFTAAQS